jgi:cytochrome c peroxidase
MKKVFVVLLFCLLLMFTSFKSRHTFTPYHFPELLFFPPMPANEANAVTKEGAALGRYLFYDPILSKDSTMSCNSCHKQEHAFSDAPNVFSKGRDGSLLTRNTLPLFNLAWYPSLFWDGKAVSIEEQVFHPVRAHNEMGLQWVVATERIKRNRFYRQKFNAAFGDEPIDSTLVAKAIAQFERTLLSYRSRYDMALKGKTFFTKDEREGLILMNDMTKGDCLHCHTTDADALGTMLTFSNNGLDTATNILSYKDRGRGGVTGRNEDVAKFKVPSLRNIALTAPYMHDGRFKTLEEVLDFYSEGVHAGINTDSKMGMAYKGGVHLTKEEKKQIIIFLKTLTDSAFITEPAFSNPFTAKK